MTRKPKPVSIAFRLPLDLYESVDAYAEGHDVNLSEALRRLVVQALDQQGWKVTEDRGDGPELDESWKAPLAPEDQD